MTSLARLVFHPQQLSDTPADMDQLLNTLLDMGLIGEKQADNAYLPGSEFLQLLSFLGCSPHIHLHPNDGHPWCYLQINPPTDSALCLGYTVSVVPRCPACQHRIKQWRDLDGWRRAESLYTCEQCATVTPMPKLKWRQECGYGRFSFHIAHIHPHEAVPADKLLGTLEQNCGFPWSYCYANN